MAEMSPLRRRMIEDMRIRNLSPATQKSYVQAVAKFSHHFKRSPARLGAEQVRVYQLHLVARGISCSERNKVVSALRFFYRVTLGRSDLPEHIPHAKQPRKLPVVLSPQEVVRFLQAVPELNKRVALTTAYSAGLRVSEVTHLKVGDIDSRRMLIRVEAGKSLPSRKRGAARIVTLVSHRNCWGCCAGIISWCTRATGSFPAVHQTGRCRRPPSMPPAARPMPLLTSG